jgi:hypothetical protein
MQFRPNIGIGAVYRLLPHISVRADLNYFRLYSADVYEKRNLGFRSGNVEVFFAGQYDLYAYTRHFRKRKRFQPFIFAGVGATYFAPYGEDPLTGKWVALRPLKTEGQESAYVPIALVFPYGVGFRFKWKPKYDFVFEGGYRNAITDYIDDVSSETYKDPTTFEDPIAARMSARTESSPIDYGLKLDNLSGNPRGNPKMNDGYFIFQVKFRYIVGAKNMVFKGKHPLLKPHHK